MIRINILVEGPTEELFVNNILRPYFAQSQKYIYVRRWFTNRRLHIKGGGRSYDLFFNDMIRWIKQEGMQSGVYFTMMIDFYGFPKQGKTPYYKEITKITDCYEKIKILEEKISEQISHHKFIPYIQLHEFETLLLTSVDCFKSFFITNESEIEDLKQEISFFSNPEEINETPHGAPSKRIIKHLPRYEKLKSTAGPIIAENIGLSVIRQKCRHFNEWISKLESIT